MEKSPTSNTSEAQKMKIRFSGRVTLEHRTVRPKVSEFQFNKGLKSSGISSEWPKQKRGDRIAPKWKELPSMIAKILRTQSLKS